MEYLIMKERTLIHRLLFIERKPKHWLLGVGLNNGDFKVKPLACIKYTFLDLKSTNVRSWITYKH